MEVPTALIPIPQKVDFSSDSDSTLRMVFCDWLCKEFEKLKSWFWFRLRLQILIPVPTSIPESESPIFDHYSKRLDVSDSRIRTGYCSIFRAAFLKAALIISQRFLSNQFCILDKGSSQPNLLFMCIFWCKAALMNSLNFVIRPSLVNSFHWTI